MKLALLAPRYHTNQIELVRYLQGRGVDVQFLVTGIGQSEDHTYLEPHRIKMSWIFQKWTSLVEAGSKSFIYDYKWGVPSWSELRSYSRSGFDAIVVRSPYSLVAIIYAVLSRLHGTSIVFYTQRPLYREPDAIRDTVAKSLMGLFGARWITPCLGDEQRGEKLEGMSYVPFCMPVREVDRKWFKDGAVNILSVGKFVKRKNHDLLIESLESLSSEYKFKLTIVGEVSDITGDAIFSEISRMASEAPFEVKIRVNLNRDEIFDLYEESDLFVLAADREPASVSNLEAMSFGLPVIVSDANQTACYLDGNGLIFETGSVEDLSKKLRMIISDRKFLLHCGERSRELVAERHDSQKVYKSFLERILRRELF